MADIDVQRKGMAIWPWILGLLLAAVLIWGLEEMLGEESDEVVMEETPAVAPISADSPMAATVAKLAPPAPAAPADTPQPVMNTIA